MKTIQTKLDSLSAAELATLRDYVERNGRRWKSTLAHEWANGSVELRELRNAIGPSGLSRLKTNQILG